MFLTSNPHLLNRTEKQAWRQAGIRPLRRNIPVRGINKTTEGRKHTTLAVRRGGRGFIKDCYVDENGLYLEAQHQLIHSPPLTPLALLLYCLCKTPDLLICLCLTDPCHSRCWRIIRRVAGSPSCLGPFLYVTLPP